MSGEVVQTTNLPERHRLRIGGVVQGVGFRPFVFGLASRLQLAGSVANDGSGVVIEVQGPASRLDEFEKLLTQLSPSAARVDSCQVETIEPLEESCFQVAPSQPGGHGTLVCPDSCVCNDCLQELRNPHDRRFGYAFLNCTQCGPRFTILGDTPYDRPFTTMRDFTMCPACAREYTDPADRRFHAQPNACPACGPRLEWWREGRRLASERPLERAVEMLVQGGVVAVKGLGGYHLACDARCPEAVARVRRLKRRPYQPLAVMARDLASLAALAEIGPAEQALLTSRERPIVLLRGQPPWEEGLPWMGAMLPYTPLHELLLQAGPDLLIMTSANPPGVPILYGDPLPVQAMADAVLSHDRPIQAPCDDSVAFVFRDAPVMLRRSRGYVPLPLELPFEVPPLLAVGAELKNVLGLAGGRQAFLSQHLGDLQNLETLQAFEQSLAHFRRLFHLDPEAVAVDLHPGYLGRRWAEGQSWPLVPVQHHHAHLAALMAEHGLGANEELLGFCFDGTGYGPDHTLWGGEVLRAGYERCQRLAHFSPMPIVGGDGALRHPYRLALTYLWQAGLDPAGLACEQAATRAERDLLHRRWQLGQSVSTSSAGRLFDVVASLCGVCQEVTFEGQAAVWLEACADEQAGGSYDFDWNVPQLLAQVVSDLRCGVRPGTISARFHRGLAAAVRATAVAAGAERVGLTGGVFQNRILLKLCVQELEVAGVQVLWHRRVPANDGGLALGQLAVAGARRRG